MITHCGTANILVQLSSCNSFAFHILAHTIFFVKVFRLGCPSIVSHYFTNSYIECSQMCFAYCLAISGKTGPNSSLAN